MATDINVNRRDRALLMMDRLDKMRKDKTRFDFKIKVEEETILAQPDILIAGSDYFKAMLSHDTKENQNGEVEMKNVDFECVKICIDFIYVQEISVPPEKYENLMFVARMMQLKKLCEEIEELMIENINQKTFFELKRIAELYECSLLSRKCKEFAEENFQLISREREFNDIDRQYMLSLIESKRTKIPEKEKLDILLKWVKHDLSRKADTIYLLNGVNLDEIPIGHRRYLMEKEPLIAQDFECFRKFSISALNFAKVPMTDPNNLPKGILIFDDDCKKLHLYDPHKNQVTETNLPELDIPCHYSVTTLEEHIYILGENKSVHRLKYSDETATWERMADMVDDHGGYPPAVLLSGHIYVIGSFSGINSIAAEKYDPMMNEWQKLPNKQMKSNGAAVLAFQGSIYSLGGWINRKFSKKVEVLDVGKSQWSYFSSMKERRTYHSASALEGNIIVAGGRNVERYLNSVEQYDAATNQWTMLPNMNIDREEFQLLNIEGQIFALGGVNKDDSASCAIEKYNPDEEEWTKVELPEGTELCIYESAVVKIDSSISRKRK